MNHQNVNWAYAYQIILRPGPGWTATGKGSSLLQEGIQCDQNEILKIKDLNNLLLWDLNSLNFYAINLDLKMIINHFNISFYIY